MEKSLYFCTRFRKEEVCFFREQEVVEILKSDAEIAQLVEHDLAKVGVASSSLVFRSNLKAQRGNSSVGRARPCQGRGREFESRFPLKSLRKPKANS